MPPNVNQGVRGSGILDTEDRKVRDVAPALMQLEPDEGPLTTILMRIGAMEASDAEFEWYEDELNPRFDALSANIADGAAVVMTVANPTFFRKGDLVKIANTEIVRVLATPTGNPVSIERGVGTTAAAAHTSGDQLHLLSGSNEEGSGKRDLLSTQRVKVTNFAQIFKTPFGVTETQDATKQFAGQDLQEERAKKLVEHKRDIEQAIIFGEKDIKTSGTHPERATGGILEFLTTNVVDASGTLTEGEWEDFLRRVFRFGSREKVVLCSPKVIQVINSFSVNKLETKSDESTYGVTMTFYQNAGRKVALVEHVLLTNDDLTDLTGIAGLAICVDIRDLKLRFMRGLMVGLKENIQDNDEDQRIDQYLSETGLQLAQERRHGELFGVTG